MLFVYQPTLDGRIIPYHVRDDGTFLPIPGGIVRCDPLSVMLAAHPSAKVLYASTRFVFERDGWNTSSPAPRPTSRERSSVYVYRIATDGRLTLAQTLPVRGILGNTMVYPDGEHLFAELPNGNYLVFGIDPDGRLSIPHRFTGIATFYLEGGSGVSDQVDISLTPHGKTGYIHRHWLLLDTSGDSLQPLQIAANGALRLVGESWETGKDNSRAPKIKGDPGRIVYSPDGRYAIMISAAWQVWHCPIDQGGRIQVDRCTRSPLPGSRRDQVSPFFQRQQSGEWRLYVLVKAEKGFTLFHLPAPGKYIKTASFGSGEQSECLWAPTGRLLYETFTFDAQHNYLGDKMRCFHLDESGRVTPASGFRNLDTWSPESMVFVER